MIKLLDQAASVLRRVQQRLVPAAAGGWGLVTQGGATTAALIERQAGGRLRLHQLHTLARSGDSPLRRMSDLMTVMRKPAARCSMLMPAEDYKVMFMPGLPVAPAERPEALKWRLKEDVEFPIDEAVIECVGMANSLNETAPEIWMVVIAQRRKIYEMIGSYRTAGVAVVSVDVAEMAQRNLAMQTVPAGRTVAMLTLDRQHGLLTISRDDGMYATRQLDPIATALAEDDSLKRGALIERLALELQRTFDNVERQYGAGPIDKVVIQSELAAGAVLAGLGQELSVPVVPLALADFIDCAEPDLLEKASLNTLSALAVGAALRFDPDLVRKAAA